MLFKLCILSYLVTLWDTFLCFTSLLIRFLYSVLSSPSLSLLLSPVTKLNSVLPVHLFSISQDGTCVQKCRPKPTDLSQPNDSWLHAEWILKFPKTTFLAKTCGVAAVNILLGPLSPNEEWLCWKKLFGISYRPIFSFFFGETSKNTISRMLRDVLYVLNSIFANHI